ncbi:four helix bundle protein [Candidatus Uhrbacteria bacterium]|nr:four helix bundle protein [Candidatus Uhrbacteria bacterium]
MAYLSYRQLEVWQRSMDLVDGIYKLTKVLPGEERYGLVSQMRRCAVSIPSNIAEGKARGTTKEYRHFVQNAYGSGAELETQLEICVRQNFVSSEQAKEVFALLDQVVRMLNRLIQKLSPQRSNP